MDFRSVFPYIISQYSSCLIPWLVPSLVPPKSSETPSWRHFLGSFFFDPEIRYAAEFHVVEQWRDETVVDSENQNLVRILSLKFH
jgi:hypothetical protein